MSERVQTTAGGNRKAVRKTPTIGTHCAWRPSGPVRSMLNNELRQIPNISRMMENLVARALGAKYPKQLERLKILREESI